MLMRAFAIAVFMCLTRVAAAETVTPLLVELFTAQGCPSCPQADEVLTHLAKRDDIVALAFHVDYWDNTGWRDRFALPEAKTRQNGYRRAFRHQQVFTPQMVINGTVDTPGQALEGVDKILSLIRARTPQGPVLTMGRDSATMLDVSIGAAPAWDDAVVWMATFDRTHTVDIKRGKNRGKTVTNVNIVRELRNLGPYSGQLWKKTIDVTAVPPEQGIAVWLQPKDQGPVASAAFLAD
ncbi:MAG: DUF1223 domain-containing protein [Rhodospirillaceae bacterium]|nr:DUF1223 domain-containing protein [Rhodospirillaceae bacterium]